MIMHKRSVFAKVAAFMILLVMLFLVPFTYQVKAADSDIVTLHVGYYIEPTSKDAILKRINEIRLEACKEGVPFGGKALTEADYVPIRWSSDMEEIAYIRALESTVLFDHTRPNGESCFSVKSYYGQGSFGECIASIGDAIADINLWYSEKSILVNGENGVTGHYEALISPYNTYVGIASCGATVGEFTSYAPESEDQIFTEPTLISTDIEFRESMLSFQITGNNHVKPGEEDYLYLTMRRLLVMSDVSWTSDNTGVLTVENDQGAGLVKGVSSGSATVTATCHGRSASYKVSVAEPKWRRDSNGWWYDYGDGTYPRAQYAQIDGEVYLFDWNGYMITGWRETYFGWYYFKPSGAMAFGWTKVGGVWYYMDPESGLMQTGWRNIGGIWYYLNGSGAMATGWNKISGKWYYMNPSGAMVTGWNKIGGIWYYMHDAGDMETGWEYIDGVWYHFDPSGAMQTGWQKINNIWYYFNGSGAMQTGIVEINGVRHSFDGSGAWLGEAPAEEPAEPADQAEDSAGEAGE